VADVAAVALKRRPQHIPAFISDGADGESLVATPIAAQLPRLRKLNGTKTEEEERGGDEGEWNEGGGIGGADEWHDNWGDVC
jgi:hypothetical protein